MRTFVPTAWRTAPFQCRCPDCRRARGVAAEVRLAAWQLRERARAAGLPDAATLAEVEAAEARAGIQTCGPVAAQSRPPSAAAREGGGLSMAPPSSANDGSIPSAGTESEGSHG